MIQTPNENLHPIIRLAMRLYNSGYKAGHHDTVEAMYVDIFDCDMENYHEGEAQEKLEEFIGYHDITKEEWAEWFEYLEENTNA